MKRKLYLFDFDGTLTKKDTLFDFLKFSFPKKYEINYLFFLPLFVGVKLKIIGAGKVKELFVSKFMKGFTKTEINQLSQNYFNSNYPDVIHPKADSFIKSINNYHDKYIVSASLNLWLEPFADHYGMGLICTEAEFDDNNIFTGRFSQKNCNYQEKARRIESEIDLVFYDEVIAYGDSEGDKPMFLLADQTHYKYFE